MVEPFAAAIRNSLFPVRAVLQSTSYSIASTAKAMTGSTSQRNLQTSFFSSRFLEPLPYQAKGKEKEREPRLRRVLQCREWSCSPTEHFVYVTDHGLRYILQELMPPQQRLFHRPQSQRLQLPSHNKHRHVRRTSLNSQRKHTSGTLQLVSARPLSTAQPEASTSTFHLPSQQHVIDRLRELAQTPVSEFDHQAAWDTYMAAEKLSCLSALSPNLLLQFACTLCTKIELECDRGLDFPKFQSWRDRIRNLTEMLQGRIDKIDGKGYQTLQCLAARSKALCGDPEAGLRILDGVRWRWRSKYAKLGVGHTDDSEVLDDGNQQWRSEFCDPEIAQTYESICASVFYYQDGIHVVALMEYRLYDEYFRPPYCYFFRDPANPGSLQRRYPRLLSILATIRDPLPFFRRHLSSNWSTIGCILILAYCEHGLGRLAHVVYEAMNKSRLRMHDLLRLRLVRALARAKAFDSAHQVFAATPTTTPEYVETGMHLFASQGDAPTVFAYYNDQKISNRKRHGRLMSLYSLAIEGKTGAVEEIFEELYPRGSQGQFISHVPTAMDYAIVIFAHARCSTPEGITRWLDRMTEQGVEPNAHMYSSIMQSYMQSAKLSAIADVLDQMQKAGIAPNAVLYTNIITALTRNNKPRGAELIFKRALREGIKPDHIMVGALMNCYVVTGAWDEVVALFESLEADNKGPVHLTIELYNMILKAYILLGTPFRAVAQLFEQLDSNPRVNPTEVTFTLLLQSACDSRQMNAALEIFREMERRAKRGVKGLMNAYAFTILIAGYLRQGKRDRAMAIYEKMLVHGIIPTSVTYNTVLSYYTTEQFSSSLHLAYEFMTRIVKERAEAKHPIVEIGARQAPIQTIYEPVLKGYAAAGDAEGFERLLEELLEAGGQMTVSVLTSLLDLYRRKDRVESARKVWDHLLEQGVETMQADEIIIGESSPSDMLCVPLSVYLDTLSRAGKYAEVLEVWRDYKEKGFNFNFFNWNRLGTYLIRAGEYEQAFEVLDRVILPYVRQTVTLVQRDLRASAKASKSSSAEGGEHKAEFTTPFEILNNTTLSFLDAAVGSKRPLSAGERVQMVGRHAAEDELNPSFDLSSSASSEGNEHVPEFIRPLKSIALASRNVPKPHQTLMQDLLIGYQRLRAGQPAIPSVDPSSTDDMYYIDNSPEQRARARKQMEYIHSQFPDAVRAVLQFEETEKGKWGEQYERMYIWS